MPTKLIADIGSNWEAGQVPSEDILKNIDQYANNT